MAVVLLLLSACRPATPKATAVPVATATITPPPIVPTMAPGSGVGIPEEALKGVTVQAWMPWFGVDTELFQSQVNAFNSSNQWGITVQAVSEQNYSELYDSVSTALTTLNSERPQLVIALPEQALAWDAAGQVVDLTRYVGDPRYGLTASEAQDFPAVFWSQDVVAGRRLGMPAQRTARFLLYNASWGQELGFTSPPKNADEFMQQACRAHQVMLTDTDRTNDGQGGWLVDESSMTFLSWMMAFGGGIVDGPNYQFLTPKNLSALTFVKQLYDSGCAWMSPPDTTPADAFAARHALFATAALEDLPDFSRAMATAGNTDEWTVLPFPAEGHGKGTLVTYGSSYVILKSTPEQQLASWLFVRWLLSPDNQKKWVEVNGMFPLRTATLSLLGDYQKTHPQWVQAVSLLPSAQIEPQLASWREVNVMIGDGFDAMFHTNTPAGRVAEVLAIMQNTAQDLNK